MSAKRAKFGPSPTIRRSTTKRGFPALRQVDPSTEQAVGITVEELTALYVLDSIKGFGPQKFKELHRSRTRPTDLIAQPSRLPCFGKSEQGFRKHLRSLSRHAVSEVKNRAVRQILAAKKDQANILAYDHPHYPSNVYESNTPVPVLYARGALSILTERRAVACVGSRAIRPPYSDLHARFAHAACLTDFTIVSGFALGADTIGHRTAQEMRGRTICVMPCGLDRPFPPENRQLWDELLDYSGGVFVTEFAFGTRAASLTLRKRNKLIVALALGVLLSQSSSRGGAMNSYRFAIEQRKPLGSFSPDSTDDTSGNAEIEQACLQGKLPSGSTIFPICADDGFYASWLRQLSSSI
jgi:DNA processing protein